MSSLRVECTSCGYQWSVREQPMTTGAETTVTVVAPCVQCGAGIDQMVKVPSAAVEALS